MAKTVAQYNRWLDNHAVEAFRVPPIREPFYHYTTEAGLRGIITSRTVHARYYRDLSDDAELRHADEAIATALDRLRRGWRGSVGRAVLERFADDYKVHSVSAHPAFNFHVACFCKAANRPALWERFGHDGLGYCLGFLPVDNPRHHVAGVEAFWQHVSYNPGAEADAVADHARIILARAQTLRRDERVKRSAYIGIMQFAAFTALRTKAPSFVDEQELRLLVWPRGTHSLATHATPPRWIAWPLRADGQLPLLERVDIGHRHGPAEVVRVRGLLEHAGYGSDGAPPMPIVSIVSLP